MKHTKRLVAVLVVAMAMALALCATAFAADGEEGGNTPNAGSITIKGTTAVPVTGKTFNAYKILDATFGANGATAYQVPTEMKNFYVQRYALTGTEPNFGEIVAGKIAVECGENNSFAAFKFTKEALQAAKTANITPKVGIAEENDTSVTISDLPFGYYVVEDVGTATPISALMLDTVGTVEITIKADKPSIGKVIVSADSNNGNEGNGTAQDVGSKVDFRLTSEVPDMTGYTTYTYTVHDTLSKGLTPVKTGDNVIDAAVTIGGTAFTDFTVQAETITNASEDSTNFKVVFGNSFINQTKGADIVITYSATINDNALTTNVETNTVNLEYSSNPNDDSATEKTPCNAVSVYDFDIALDKYAFDKSNENNHDIKLAGAEFILYKKVTENETAKYYKWDDTDKKVEWVDSESDATKVTTDNQGKATFRGLDSAIYYLHETKAPIASKIVV